MKYSKQLTALITVILLTGSSFASAKALDSGAPTYTLPSFTVEGVSDPVLQSYSTPRIPASKYGTEITMYYTISERGVVQQVRSDVSPFSERERRTLAIIMSQAIKTWKFQPATNGAGEPVAIKVSMPVKVASPASASNAFAGIVVDEMELAVKES